MQTMLSLLLALATPSMAEPLQEPYRDCSQQTLDTALALERAGDRRALRDHSAELRLQAILSPRAAGSPARSPDGGTDSSSSTQSPPRR